jgi:hypothetical protein
MDCMGVAMMMPVQKRTTIMTTMIQWNMRKKGLNT